MRLLPVLVLAFVAMAEVLNAGSMSGSGAGKAFNALVKSKKPAVLFNFESKRFCPNRSIRTAPSSVLIPRTGHSGSHTRKLNETLQWFNKAISSAVASPQQAKALAKEMTVLAQARAYTKQDWSGSGSNPAHWASVLLKNVAIAVNVIDHRGGWSPGQREAVVKWGDTLWKTSHFTAWGARQSDRWPDTVAAAATAYVYWGIASHNKRAFTEGLRDFDKVVKSFKANGTLAEFYDDQTLRAPYRGKLPDNWGVRIEDKLIGDLVMTAHAIRHIGGNLFDYKAGKGTTLYEVVVNWQNTLFANGGAASRGQDKQFLRAHGGEASWSWTEYFVANYPADPQTSVLRQRSARYRGGGYVGVATGPASCLLR
jgi:hypothetical protein